MISKNSRIFLLITILIFQVIVVKSQTYSVNPITPTSSPEPTSSIIPISLTNHIIKVGYMDYGFSRNNFSVDVGNVLHWEWVGDLVHSVVESTPETPCKRKEGGFDLGQHTQPFNSTMAFNELKTVVFFSDVSDDCAKGMYGGINLPQDYTWPKDLAQPPAQIVTTPLNPALTPTPTPTSTDDLGTVTGSMSIAAEATKNAQESSSESGNSSPSKPVNSTESSSDSTSTYYLKESIYGIIIRNLMLISFTFYNVIYQLA